MSDFILIFNRDRTPVVSTMMARMMAALVHRGPDGADTYHSAVVGWQQAQALWAHQTGQR